MLVSRLSSLAHKKLLCASEDSRDVSISISSFLMLMLMFSEDIVDISNSAR